MPSVFRLCKDFALCQVGKESSIYITSLEAGPGPGEQRIRLYLQTQRETNPHLLKISKFLWIIITTRYSTVDLLLSSRSTPRPNNYNYYRHALLHGRNITINIATRYTAAELYNQYHHALQHGQAIAITIITHYSTAELLVQLSPRATPRPNY